MPGPIAAVLLGLCREHPQVDRAPASTKRREAANRAAAARAFDDARQLVEVIGPGAQPFRSSSPADRFGDGLPGRRGELLLQRVEVLAAGDLGAVRGLDGERHPQMRRQLVEVERVDRHENTGAAP